MFPFSRAVSIIPLHFSLLAQWNPTELVALPIPLGKPKEKRSKKKRLVGDMKLFSSSP
jgi:hypothetical protein